MNLRIATFIAVSTLAHGAAVLWFNTSPTPRLALGGESQTLRVTLQSAAQVTDYGALEARSARTPPSTANSLVADAHQPQATAPTRRAADPDKIRSTERHTLIVETSSSAPRETNPPATGPHDTTSQHSSATNVSQQISAALKNQLAQHFVYPWLARQRGWQGQVLLSLHVAGNGDLSHWKVVKTSGYRTLDESALKAAKRIARLPLAQRWLNGASLEMRLPVQYKLLDS